MRRDDSESRIAGGGLVIALTCALALAAIVPAAAPARGQADDPATSDNRRCFPGGGWDLTVGSGNPHMNLTIHTSLLSDPSPPSAVGLAARGTALDAEIVELRTGVLLEDGPGGVSLGAVLDALVVLFDFRLSLPMFDGPAYEPDDGPVSGVETREC